MVIFKFFKNFYKYWKRTPLITPMPPKSKALLSSFDDFFANCARTGNRLTRRKFIFLRFIRQITYRIFISGFARIFHNYWKRTPLITPMPPTICLPRPQLQQSPKGIYALFVATYPIHIVHPVE